MQKVEGSSAFIRSQKSPENGAFFVVRDVQADGVCNRDCNRPAGHARGRGGVGPVGGSNSLGRRALRTHVTGPTVSVRRARVALDAESDMSAFRELAQGIHPGALTDNGLAWRRAPP